MAIDLGNTPTGTPPTAGEKLQIRSAIGVGTTDAPTFLSLTLTNGTVTSSTGTINLGGRVVPTGMLGIDGSSGLFEIFNDLTTAQARTITSRSASFGRDGLAMRSIAALAWTSGNGAGTDGGNLGTADTILVRDGAAGILAQRNGSAAQTQRTYNNYTSATVFERGTFGFPTATNRLRIGTEFLGAGMAALPVDFVTGDVVRMSISGAGKIGIGTTTPLALLDIRGANDAANGLQVGGTSANVGNFITLHGNATNGGTVRIFSNYNTTEGALVLGTFGNQSTLYLATTGNVGIGTTTPAAKLHLTGGDTNLGFASASIALGLGTSGTYPHFIHTRHNATLNGNAIDFYTCDSNAGGVFPTNAIHGLTINNGSVGIGTTNPVADLDIADTWNAPALAVTGASGTGTTATLTFATQLTPIPVGSTIVVAGITPAGYNGTFVVTGSTTSTVLYANATTGAGTGGTIERVFTSVKLNVTDTASNAASLLMDLQFGGVSRCKVSKAGNATFPIQVIAGATGNAGQTSGLVANGIYLSGGTIYGPSTQFVIAPGVGISQNAASYLAWGDGASAVGTIDTYLFRDGAPGILAQRNGTLKQVLRVYNTALSGAPEWGGFDWQTTTNTLRIGTDKTGTGASQPIDFVVGGAVKLSLGTNGLNGPTNSNMFGQPTVTIVGCLEMTSSIFAISNSFLIEGAVQKKIVAGDGYRIGFASSLTGTPDALRNAMDIAIGRNAGGVMEINNGTTGTFRDLRVRSVIQQPPATITPASNGDLVFEATSNTSLTLKLKGTDGTVRSVALTLA